MILSVVIPTHDKCDLLSRTLRALERQVVEGPWEIVVIDDASRDGTARELSVLGERLGARLVVRTAPGNLGRAGARNLGIETARGRWVLFLDDDIVVPAGLLAAHLRILEDHPDNATIGLVRTDPSLVDAPHFHYIDSRGCAKLNGDFAPARYFVTQNACVPRAVLEQVGGFDTRFAAYGMEDMEIAFRLEEEAGVRFRILREPVPVHVHHHTLADYLDKKRECGAETIPLLARLHPGRIREMSLDWVIDAPGDHVPGPGVRVFRWLAGVLPAAGLAAVANNWPADADGRPRCAAIHARLMDFCIMQAYRNGMTHGRSPRHG